MTTSQAEKCVTCYGQGEVSGIGGLQACTDCGGVGELPSGMVLAERRLRELETSYGRQGGQVESDVRWLVDEMRRSRHALVQILAAAQDADSDDPLAPQVRFLANGVLGMYPTEKA